MTLRVVVRGRFVDHFDGVTYAHSFYLSSAQLVTGTWASWRRHDRDPIRGERHRHAFGPKPHPREAGVIPADQFALGGIPGRCRINHDNAVARRHPQYPVDRGAK